MAEYPAPPAVANNYIQSQGWKLTSGQRGCIIKKIAGNHAHDSKYGPKGGPYDEPGIRKDVDLYKDGDCKYQ